MSKLVDILDLLKEEDLTESPYLVPELKTYATPRISPSGAIDRTRIIPGAVVREVELGDLLSLEQHKSMARHKPLKSVRDSHHRVARLFAKGMTAMEISLATGFSPKTLEVYRQDQTMIELISHYEEIRDEIAVDLTEKYKALVGDAHGELTERLSEEPEAFSSSLLFEMMKDLGDRVGQGPTSKLQASLMVGIVDDDTIRAIKEQANGIHRGLVIQGKAREISRESTGSERGEDTAGLREQELQRSTGQGDQVSEESGEVGGGLEREGTEGSEAVQRPLAELPR